MSLNDLRDEVGKWAEEKGWNDRPRTFGEDIALMHSELSEALEEHRKKMPGNYVYYEPVDGGIGKPEGIPVELADVIIRILHTAAKYDIDLDDAYNIKMQYNGMRPYRHGDKAI